MLAPGQKVDVLVDDRRPSRSSRRQNQRGSKCMVTVAPHSGHNPCKSPLDWVPSPPWHSARRLSRGVTTAPWRRRRASSSAAAGWAGHRDEIGGRRHRGHPTRATAPVAGGRARRSIGGSSRPVFGPSLQVGTTCFSGRPDDPAPTLALTPARQVVREESAMRKSMSIRWRHAAAGQATSARIRSPIKAWRIRRTVASRSVTETLPHSIGSPSTGAAQSAGQFQRKRGLAACVVRPPEQQISAPLRRRSGPPPPLTGAGIGSIRFPDRPGIARRFLSDWVLQVSAGSVNDGSRSQPSFSSLMCSIAMPVPPASRSGRA